jgi:hypothetical protein
LYVHTPEDTEKAVWEQGESQAPERRCTELFRLLNYSAALILSQHSHCGNAKLRTAE